MLHTFPIDHPAKGGAVLVAVPPFVCSQKQMSSCQVKAKCFMKQKSPPKDGDLYFSVGHSALGMWLSR